MPRSCSDAFYFHLVYEYLVHMGMDSTSRRMLEECDVYGYPIPYLSEMGVSMEEINKLLQYFDDENCADFFKDFEMAVPVNVQSTTDCRKLKLGLHVYFAITGLQYEKDVPSANARNGGGGGKSNSDRRDRRDRSAEDSSADSDGPRSCTTSCPCKNPHCMCRSDGGSVEAKACMKSKKYCKAEGRPEGSRQLAHPCMATLLAFLEKDGSELSKEPELLPYFALPFILDPEAHPHYEHLFKPPWSSNLRRWLWNFLISHRQASRVPELVLLLPDLHSALSGRTGRTISSIGQRVHSSCPSTSDQDICMNHVTSSAHGKQRVRQYHPAKDSRQLDPSPKEVHTEAEEKADDFGNPPDSDLVRKPVTFHPRDRPDNGEETEGTSGSGRPIRSIPVTPDDYNNIQDADGSCNQTCVLYGSLKSRYNQLHNDYHNLLGVAAELTDALEHCVRGDNIDLTKTLENCSALFPELIKMQEQYNDEANARKTPMQNAVHDQLTPRQANSQIFRPTSEQAPRQVSERRLTTEQTTREMLIIADDPAFNARLEGAEPPHATTSTTTPLKQNKARFDQVINPTKSNNESYPAYSDNVNPFCTSTMIPLYLMQNNERTRTDITCELNFKAVKHDLYMGSVKRMLLLLQALRWRLTGTSNEQRMSAIESYTKADLLAIVPDTLEIHAIRVSDQASLLERLLMPCSVKSPHPLQQASSRLINAMASIRMGRSYLVRSPSVVDVHVRTLYQAELDTITSEMVIATLQKLSLRQSQRRLMIQSNLVEWLADQMTANVNNRSVYWLKYTAALLMNLCLHTEARERCVPAAKKTLESIVEWMRATMVDVSASSLSPPAAALLPYIQNSEGKLHSIPRVRMAHLSPKALPYLNGVLYTLISHPEINQAATEIGLGKSLHELIVIQDDLETRCQLGHILTLHRENILADSPTVSLQINQDVEDGKWVLDLLEDELDTADPVKGGPNDLSGELLLCRYYSILNADSKDTVNSPQQTETPTIDQDEGQLPLRLQTSSRLDIRQSENLAAPVVLTPEMPQCPFQITTTSLDTEIQSQAYCPFRNKQSETTSKPKRRSIILPLSPSQSSTPHPLPAEPAEAPEPAIQPESLYQCVLAPFLPEAPPTEPAAILPEIPRLSRRSSILPEDPESTMLHERSSSQSHRSVILPESPSSQPRGSLHLENNVLESVCFAVDQQPRSQKYPPQLYPSIPALPVVTSKQSTNAATPPRTSVSQPSSSRATTYPSSSLALHQNVFFPPRSSINLPEVTDDWTRTAIVLPETKSPRISNAKSPAEEPKTAVVLPETSSGNARSSVQTAFQETAPSNIAQPVISNSLSSTSLSLDPNSDPMGIQAPVAVSEGISMSAEELDSRFESEDSPKFLSISYTKEEHVVRCRTPENIEVIVAVTLSSDCVPHSEDERPDQIVRKYKKLVNKLRTPQKEIHESPSKSRQPEHLNDKSENDVKPTGTTVNIAVPGNAVSRLSPRSPKVCGIWNTSDLTSDTEISASKSSRQEDGQVTKDSIFGPRPRIPRTPPDEPRRSTQSSPKSKRKQISLSSIK